MSMRAVTGDAAEPFAAPLASSVLELFAFGCVRANDGRLISPGRSVSRVKLLSEQDLATVESHLRSILDARLDAQGLRPMRQAMADYVMAGGKRVRPQLAIWTWTQCSGCGVQGSVVRSSVGVESSLLSPLLDLACGWELFHAFLLIHDDIIDASDVRRDQAALHVSLAALDNNSAVFGRNLAIVAGDLLFSTAMQLWHDLDVSDPRVYRDLLKLFSRIATTTGFGQAIDIIASHQKLDDVDEETLLREYHWKTAAYTFEGPMLSGAILAGLGLDAQRAISQFALSLGQAYQLQNDLIDLYAPAHDGCDLVQGKRTLTLVRYRSRLTDRASDDLDFRLDAISKAQTQGTAPGLAEALRLDLLASDIARPTHDLIDALLTEAHAAAEDGSLPEGLSKGMSELLGALTKQYFMTTSVVV
jgi:geranylgeranyl diphosphate synthase, type I